jgi:asparagine synthase (glutamine-hydrolysing)
MTRRLGLTARSSANYRMPGLAGLVSRKPANEARRLVTRMSASMQHEDFHIAGAYAAEDIGVFVGWVALEDSFAHRETLLGQRSDVVILVAGECFFDTHCNTGLVKRGRGERDDKASSLIDLYEKVGDRFFEQLNGVFSGVLIDLRRRTAMLFNDRYGMERIYYYEAPEELYFASEAKALLHAIPETRGFDRNGLAEFIQYGCTLGPTTLFHDIKILPAGSVWTLSHHTRHKRHYFTPTMWESQPPLTATQFLSEFEHTFARVLPRYFTGEQQLGISLTGGLDTRMIMACRSEVSPGLVSYTFAGTNGETLDVQLAAKVAAVCGVPHYTLRIGQDFFSEFASLVDRTVYMTDGYFGPCGAHEIYLNNQARALAPTRLTGNFGSEILRDATTFKPLGLSSSLLNQDVLSGTAEPTVSLRAIRGRHPVTFSAFAEIPWHLFGVFRAAQSQVNMRSPYLDNELVALTFRAPEEIRRSSSSALRVIRANDAELGRIPTDAGLVPASRFSSLIRILPYRASFKLDYWYGEGMPHWLSSFHRCLSTFGLRPWQPGLHKYLHYRNWFRTQLSSYVDERLAGVTTSGNELWNRASLRSVASDHRNGRKNYVREIDTVLTLDAVDRLLIRGTRQKENIGLCHRS